ncbi:MAG TPA: L,D-transpeptidase [Rhodocyclaceae bacterium]|nr:L,D-transpeptidase [Rhodocyclaceae bacterium]
MVVSIADQAADLYDDAGVRIRRYPVSTAAKGVGEIRDSYCTPRGRHYVRAKIGAGQPINTVFVRRRPTGELYSTALQASAPDRDWILTRILWLSGCEPGFNRLGRVDTMRRYIYLHGTPDQTPLGRPGSHGCIRIANRDIIELFDLLPVYSAVEIIEGSHWPGKGN